MLKTNTPVNLEQKLPLLHLMFIVAPEAQPLNSCSIFLLLLTVKDKDMGEVREIFVGLQALLPRGANHDPLSSSRPEGNNLIKSQFSLHFISLP